MIGLIFTLALCIIIFTIGKGISEWSYNNSQPQLSYKAQIIDKTTEDRTYFNEVNNVTTMRTETDYYITFAISSGETKKINVPYRLYKTVQTGDQGLLIMQGSRFISFS